MKKAIPRQAVPYEAQGRTSQKARTRAGIIEAAVELIEAGEAATVEAAAARAGVGPGHRLPVLPQPTGPAGGRPSARRPPSRCCRPRPLPTPSGRLRAVVREMTRMTSATEPALRTMLRLSLEDDPTSRELPLRVGRRVIWVGEALAPLAGEIGPERLQALTIAIAAACGIEVNVWLKDIAGLSDERAAGLQHWMAELLLLGGLDAAAPPAPPTGETMPAIRARIGRHGAR